MDIVLYVVLGVIALLVIMTIVIYNRLVGLRMNRQNSFADIDVQLKLRYDLVPNLVNTVKGYAKHESEVFTQVTEARARIPRGGAGGNLRDRIEGEQMLSQAMLNLFAVAENYPELKADKNFQQLQAELSDIENKIAAARRYFNSATKEYNVSIQQFPAVMIAGMFGFREATFFEIATENREKVETAPNVEF